LFPSLPSSQSLPSNLPSDQVACLVVWDILLQRTEWYHTWLMHLLLFLYLYLWFTLSPFIFPCL
jgi:hypothetical protein